MSEKGFYLQEFRRRTLGVLVPERALAERPALRGVLDELRENHTRVVLVVPAGTALDALDCDALPVAAERLEGRIWRSLRRRGRAAVASGDELVPAFVEVARRLALFKAIRLARDAGLRNAAGRRRSFVDQRELGRLLAGEPSADMELLREIEALLAAGVPTVNLCTVEGLHDELFTYTGSGTLFTRERYVVVRRLGIDDYDAADDLMSRGVAEGFLAPRPPEAVDELLADGFGAFIEGQHLAGIGALRVSPGGEWGEIASLYTMTRFAGEGVASHVVGFGLKRAAENGLSAVYACTTSARAQEFFRRLGFVAVRQEEVPREKWRGYDRQRRAQLTCLRYPIE